MSTTETLLGGTLALLLVFIGASYVVQSLGSDIDFATSGANTQTSASASTGNGSDPRLTWDRQNAAYSSEVDDALSRTLEQRIVFSTLDEIPYDEDTEVRVIVASADFEQALRDMQGLDGEVGVETADLTQRVRANLYSKNSDVTIKELGQMERTLSARANARFSWSVRAETDEPFYLTFELTNLAPAAGATHDREARAWSKQIKVSISFWDWLGVKYSENENQLNWLGAILAISAIVAGVWKRRKWWPAH